MTPPLSIGEKVGEPLLSKNGKNLSTTLQIDMTKLAYLVVGGSTARMGTASFCQPQAVGRTNFLMMIFVAVIGRLHSSQIIQYMQLGMNFVAWKLICVDSFGMLLVQSAPCVRPQNSFYHLVRPYLKHRKSPFHQKVLVFPVFTACHIFRKSSQPLQIVLRRDDLGKVQVIGRRKQGLIFPKSKNHPNFSEYNPKK